MKMLDKKSDWGDSGQLIIPTPRELDMIRLVRYCNEMASYVFGDIDLRMTALGINLSYLEVMIESLQVSVLILEEEKAHMKPKVNMNFLKDINTKLGDSNG